MTELPIEHYRLEAIHHALVYVEGGAAEKLAAARACVALMENGIDGPQVPVGVPAALPPEFLRTPEPPPTAAPRGPRPETVAVAIKSALATMVPGPAVATINGLPLADPSSVRWTDERKDLAILEIEAFGDRSADWKGISRKLAALPGMQPITNLHVRNWWFATGKKQAQRRREERAA